MREITEFFGSVIKFEACRGSFEYVSKTGLLRGVRFMPAAWCVRWCLIPLGIACEKCIFRSVHPNLCTPRLFKRIKKADRKSIRLSEYI